MGIEDFIKRGEVEWVQSLPSPRSVDPVEAQRQALLKKGCYEQTHYVMVRGVENRRKDAERASRRSFRVRHHNPMDRKLTFRCVQGGGETRPRGALTVFRCLTNYVGRLR
jgi:hypothetical protein